MTPKRLLSATSLEGAEIWFPRHRRGNCPFEAMCINRIVTVQFLQFLLVSQPGITLFAIFQCEDSTVLKLERVHRSRFGDRSPVATFSQADLTNPIHAHLRRMYSVGSRHPVNMCFALLAKLNNSRIPGTTRGKTCLSKCEYPKLRLDTATS